MNKAQWIAAAIVAGLILAATGLGWYYYYGPCGVVRVKTAATELSDVTSRFEAKSSIASSTPRNALAFPVSQMQDSLAEAQKIEVPPCMDVAKEAMIVGMDFNVSAYLAFMAQDDDKNISYLFDQARRQMLYANSELLTVKIGRASCRGRV